MSFLQRSMCGLAALAGAAFAVPAFADKFDERDDFKVREILADGRRGTKSHWEHSVDESPIGTISVELRRVAGSTDTKCTLGFDRGGSFEPREIQIDRQVFHSVTWDARGERPRGRDIVLTCRNGEVAVEGVTVFYIDDRRRGYDPYDRHHHHDDRHDDRYDDRYRYRDRWDGYRGY